MNMCQLQSAAFFMEGLHDAGYEQAINAYGQGCLEMVTEMVEYAPFSDALCEAMSKTLDNSFPGVYDYEVSVPFGREFGTYLIKNHHVMSVEEGRSFLTKLITDFFLQGAVKVTMVGYKPIESVDQDEVDLILKTIETARREYEHDQHKS